MKRLTEYESIAGHAHAVPTCNMDKAMMRLAAYEDTGLEPEEIKEFAEDVAYQFGNYFPIKDMLYISTGGLSTLESAFDILGWNDPHSVPECECEIPGCHEYANCGTPTKDGYKRVCGKHFAEFSREEAEAALAGKEPAQPTDDPEWKQRMMRAFIEGR